MKPHWATHFGTGFFEHPGTGLFRPEGESGAIGLEVKSGCWEWTGLGDPPKGNQVLDGL